MKISKDTKISRLIKHNPDVIDVIAGINKNFKKLKNPVLRKLLAPRVSISDAAKIGGTTVDVFFEKLKEIGFEIEVDGNEKVEDKPAIQNSKLENINDDNIVKLDVRSTIDAGEDPFKSIIEAAQGLSVGGVLLIVNSFEPVPLINILTEKGFESKTEKAEEEIFHTYFIKTEKAENAILKQIEKTDMSDFELTVTRFGENIKTIDVRDLEMPEPMVTILKEIEELPERHALYVHHKRVPQFLLPELKKRDFTILSQEEDKNNVKLLIYKN